MSMVQLQKTKSNFEGNLTLVVFPFLKISKQKPEDTAQAIGELLVRDCPAVASFNVVKGFFEPQHCQRGMGRPTERHSCG